MLIIPLSGKIGWKNPPVATLVLLVVNCLVFVFFQLRDDEARMAAEQFYLESGLAAIEAPLFIDERRAAGAPIGEDLDTAAMDAETLMQIHLALEEDAEFLDRLTHDRIITPQDAAYARWKPLRLSYEEQRSQSTAFSHGLRPAYPRISAFFSYMFLHGGAGHLIGNMIFLWILGCMLEIGAGRILFLGIYLAGGLAAAGFFSLIYSSSTAPLVGASGAIAGLMGAYTVLYGKKRVNIFYSLGVYFDTVRIPAIALLPAWLANECYQLFFGGASQVAYVAHIGGLVAGALLAFCAARFGIVADRESFAEAPQDRTQPLLQQALTHMGNLEMAKAQAYLDQVLESAPDNREALQHLFNIHKLQPESQAFHAIAQKKLRVLLRQPADYPEAIACYQNYAQLTRRPRLTLPLYLQVAGAMASTGKPEAAEKIILAIMRQKPQTPGLPSTLTKLAQAFRKIGRNDRWEGYRRLICKHYPDSTEASIIQRSDAAAL